MEGGIKVKPRIIVDMKSFGEPSYMVTLDEIRDTLNEIEGMEHRMRTSREKCICESKKYFGAMCTVNGKIDMRPLCKECFATLHQCLKGNPSKPLRVRVTRR